MKIITLITFKNEKHFIKTCINSVKPFSDEIITINDSSDDGSDEIATDLGAKVFNNNDFLDYGWSELSIRKKLLNLGRDYGGTHFICLDADEAISSNFKNNIEILNTLSPGQKISMQWLAMWKSTTKYRNDHSVWSNNFKDFIFFDDGKMDYPDVWMHTPRTPGENNPSTVKLVPKEVGCVLHFQFSNWEAFQIKQSWYRCSELIKFGRGSLHSINSKYSITLDDKNTILSDLESSYYSDVILPTTELVSDQTIWRLNQISEWFGKYGSDFFSGLDIWHVDKISQLINK